MPEFSFADAAFVGFRFTRERPGAVAAWAGMTFAVNVTAAVFGALIGGDAFHAFNILGSHPTWEEVVQTFPPAAPAVLVVFLINFAGAALIYASAMRSFLGTDKTVTFRAGADEKRLFLVLWLYFFVYLLLDIVTGVALGLLEAIFGLFSPTTAGLLSMLSPAIMLIVPAIVIVRLSLAPVIAVDRKRIDLKESWVCTRGHFLPLAGSLALSFVLFVIVAFVAMMLIVALGNLASVGTGGLITAPQQAMANGAAKNFSPSAIVFGGISVAIFIGVFLPVILGPQVRAYQAYDAPDPVLEPAGA